MVQTNLMRQQSMKYNIIGVALLMMVSLWSSRQTLEAQTPQPEALRWAYAAPRIERSADGEKLAVHFTITPTSEALRRSELIVITPQYVSRDGAQRYDLARYCMAGSHRYRLLDRKNYLGQSLPNGLSIDEIKLYEPDQQEMITVDEQIPYQKWMADGHIEIREEIYGCADCLTQVARETLTPDRLFVFTPDAFAYTYIEPAGVQTKSYEEEFTSYVRFRVDRHELLPTFADNKRELRRIDDFVRKALKLAEAGATVGDVYVTGYASPEGSFDHNLPLSERRANTLSNYVATTFPALKRTAHFEVKGGGEDWDGLRKAVAESGERYADQVTQIIDKYSTDLPREKDIKALENGHVYRELLDTYYPPLRRTVIKMRYDVRPYTVEELPNIFKVNPKLLSHRELFLLADTYYHAQDKSPVEVYKIAYENFGDEREAKLNYANALLQWEQRAQDAIDIVRPLGDDPDAAFVRAMAYQMLGEESAAERALRDAAQLGNKHAAELIH